MKLWVNRIARHLILTAAIVYLYMAVPAFGAGILLIPVLWPFASVIIGEFIRNIIEKEL